MQTVTVREFAWLTTQELPLREGAHALDHARISESAFDWLCELNSRMRKSGAPLVQAEGRLWLRLDNYVGVIQTPCGTLLEILPKHYENADCVPQSRGLLRRLIQAALDLPTRSTDEAALELFNAPLSEWVMRQFLQELDTLVKRGIRFEYQRVEEELHHLRGQLDVARQLRQQPGRQHLFHVRHDIHLPDRPENRLLRRALDEVCKATQEPTNWRLAHELRAMLVEVPASADITADLRKWSNGRLLAHYRRVRPWCELILTKGMPVAVAGDWRGVSLLFPMEKLFERQVEAWLRRVMRPEAELIRQASRHSLCDHDGGKIFQLEPDLLLEYGASKWVLDAKWKRLKQDRDEKYGLSQGDFYQLFAYGHRYMAGQGDLYLIYPKVTGFEQPLPVFDFRDGMRLWVVPFDLEAGTVDIRWLPGLPLKAGECAAEAELAV